MRKLLVGALMAMCVLLSACGGPSPKEEAKILNDKYYGDKGAYTVLLNEFSKKPEPEDWSKELYDQMSEFSKKKKGIDTQLINEKVSKEVEPFKNAMVAENNQSSHVFELGILELKAKLENKKIPEVENLDSKVLYSEMDQKRYERLNEYNKIYNGKPLPVIGINGKNYRAYSVSDVTLAVIESDSKKEIGKNPYMKKKALGKFIVIKVFVKNNQKDAITVDSNSFKLIDSQKREFSVSTEGQTAIQMEDNNIKGFLTKLNPGMSTDFKFVFDVPENMRIGEFELQGKGGFSGEKILMDTKPLIIKTVKN